MRIGKLNITWKREPKFPILPEHHIAPAFHDGEFDLFKFTDTFNIPCERAFAAIHHYEILFTRCSLEFLELQTQKILDILKHPSVVKVGEAIEEVTKIRERLTIVYPPELIWNLASVLFFDKTENPYSYDQKYAEQKIDRWKKSGMIYDFFLHQPFQSLMPQSGLSKQGFLSTLNVAQKIDERHWESLFQHFSTNPLNHKKIYLIKNVLSQIKRGEVALT